MFAGMTDKLTSNNVNDNTISGAKLSDATIPLGKLASSVVQLQGSAPGTAQAGHLNISGTGTFGSVSGNGSGLSNVNAATLGGIGSFGFIYSSPASPQIGGFNILGNGTVGGTLSASTLSLAGNATAGGTVAAASFSGSGSGLTSVPAAALSGTVGDASLSTNVARLSATQTFSSTNTFAGLVLPINAAAPGTCAANALGQVYLNTTSQTLQVCDGTAWRLVFPQRASTTLSAAFAVPNATTPAVVTGLNTAATKATSTSTVKVTFTGNLTFPASVSAGFAQAQLLVDGAVRGQLWTYSDAATGATYLSRPFNCVAVFSGLNQGSHTYGIQVQTGGGAGDTVAAGSTLIVEEDN
jgi:hypothetical protein